MKVKRSRFGYFLGCEDYPNCKGMGKIFNKTGFKCPKCESRIKNKELSGPAGDIVEKKSRGRGRPFWACSRWPDCDFIINKKPENEAELEELFKKFKEKMAEKSADSKKETRVAKKKATEK